MAECSICNESWPAHFAYCPQCSGKLGKPSDLDKLIRELQDRILQAQTPDHLFSIVTQIAAEHLKARIFSLYLYDPPTGKLVLRAAKGIPSEHIGSLSYDVRVNRPPSRPYLTSWLFRQDKPFFIQDIKKMRYDEKANSFVADPTVITSYVGKYVQHYYSLVPLTYSEMPFIPFMGAPLVIPDTRARLGVIKAELKVKDRAGMELEGFSEQEQRIFQAIVPTIAHAVGIANRMVTIEDLTRSYKTLLGVITDVYLDSLRTKDEFTYIHSRSVAAYARVIGAHFFSKDSEEAAMLEAAATLHDLGKLGVPTMVLQKRGDAPLTDEDWSHIRFHPEMGVNIYYGKLRHLHEDMSWLFVLLLHHCSPNLNRAYPVRLSGQKDWCHEFVSAFGLDPNQPIYDQLEALRGDIYRRYNDNRVAIYSGQSEGDFLQRYDNLKRMIEIVRVVDSIDAGSFLRAYRFNPDMIEVVIADILERGRAEYDSPVLDALKREANNLRDLCARRREEDAGGNIQQNRRKS